MLGVKHLRRQGRRNRLWVMTVLLAFTTSGCAGQLSGTTEVVGHPCFNGVFADGSLLVHLNPNRSVISAVGWSFSSARPWEAFRFEGRFESPQVAVGTAVLVLPYQSEAPEGSFPEIVVPNTDLRFVFLDLRPGPCETRTGPLILTLRGYQHEGTSYPTEQRQLSRQ